MKLHVHTHLSIHTHHTHADISEKMDDIIMGGILGAAGKAAIQRDPAWLEESVNSKFGKFSMGQLPDPGPGLA